MSKIGAREARSKFSEILHSAAYAKDRIVLTKNGRDIAALVPIEDLRLIESIEDQADVREAQRRLANPKLRPFAAFEAELDGQPAADKIETRMRAASRKTTKKPTRRGTLAKRRSKK